MKIPETYEELESNFVYNHHKKWWKRNKELYLLVNCSYCKEECFVTKNKYNSRKYAFCDDECTGKYHKGTGNPMYGKTGDKCSRYKGGVEHIALYDTYAHQLPDCIEKRKLENGHIECKCGTCGEWKETTRSVLASKIYNIKNGYSLIKNYYCSNKCRYNSHEYKCLSERKRRNKLNNNSNWNGGYSKLDIPTYIPYAKQLTPYEEVRKSINDNNILEVRCSYCNKWYQPKREEVRRRINSINGKGNGESRFYCSDECKSSCDVFKRISYPKSFINPNTYTREVQPQLRKLVLERDDWKCTKCNSTVDLHCHHIDTVINNPIESADIDNCITLCKDCHRDVHNQDGCKTNQLKC